mmetsp:Transcript_28978/g.75331  ORF Transcript_28978/g.75331 Transcript_28978/m.75331 type:complete len:335 (+) Transcript_28978:1129-2133(+)
MPVAELTEEEKKQNFRKKVAPDLTPVNLSNEFAKFSLPTGEDGFDDVRFSWHPKDKSEKYFKDWIKKQKIMCKMDDLVPGEWFKQRWTEWQKVLAEWHTTTTEYNDPVKRAMREAEAEEVKWRAEEEKKAAAAAAAEAEKKEGEVDASKEGEEKKEGDEEKSAPSSVAAAQREARDSRFSPIASAQREARLRFEKDILDRMQGRWGDEADPNITYVVEGSICSVSSGDGGRGFRNRLSVYGVEFCWDARRFWHYLNLPELYSQGEIAEKLEWNPAKDSPPTTQIVWNRLPPLPEVEEEAKEGEGEKKEEKAEEKEAEEKPAEAAPAEAAPEASA